MESRKGSCHSFYEYVSYVGMFQSHLAFIRTVEVTTFWRPSNAICFLYLLLFVIFISLSLHLLLLCLPTISRFEHILKDREKKLHKFRVAFIVCFYRVQVSYSLLFYMLVSHIRVAERHMPMTLVNFDYLLECTKITLNARTMAVILEEILRTYD